MKIPIILLIFLSGCGYSLSHSLALAPDTATIKASVEVDSRAATSAMTEVIPLQNYTPAPRLPIIERDISFTPTVYKTQGN